jgi:hypothetical protein
MHGGPGWIRTTRSTVTGQDGETVEIQSGDDASLPKGFPEDSKTTISLIVAPES